jgi:hypothetical protein
VKADGRVGGQHRRQEGAAHVADLIH